MMNFFLLSSERELICIGNSPKVEHDSSNFEHFENPSGESIVVTWAERDAEVGHV
jgi:hypothetical protein